MASILLAIFSLLLTIFIILKKGATIMETTQILFLIGIALIAIFSLIKYFKNTPKKPTTTKIGVCVVMEQEWQ
ncbi:putative membrane protein (plasmid) [Bacillus thuringiensis serovar kurstaki]|nr:putative membrane protein [Bacillus thuringiensis serovar kurstaki]AJK38631.1 putative membrane protein [Bacillus thuringiensis serovar kurstaki]USP56431.1 hypothetical protein J2N67_006680 [Bacillus thuringiensis]